MKMQKPLMKFMSGFCAQTGLIALTESVRLLKNNDSIVCCGLFADGKR